MCGLTARIASDGEPTDYVGKSAYFCPPGAETIMDAIGVVRVKSYDAVSNQFYFDGPIPEQVDRDWLMVVCKDI